MASDRSLPIRLYLKAVVHHDLVTKSTVLHPCYLSSGTSHFLIWYYVCMYIYIYITKFRVNLWENLQDFTSQEIAVFKVTAFKDLKPHLFISLFIFSCKYVVALRVSCSQFAGHLFSFSVVSLKIWTTSVIDPRNSHVRLPFIFFFPHNPIFTPEK